MPLKFWTGSKNTTVTSASGKDITDEEALLIVSGVESESEHPIARGIVKTAEDRGIVIPAASKFRALTGKGVAATVEGIEYYIGGPALLKVEDAAVASSLIKASEKRLNVVRL